jgi:hypothetical protein
MLPNFKPNFMWKLLIAGSICLMSCNNSSDTAGGNDKKESSATSQWTKEDENEFLSGCVDNAKARYSEDTAYSFCKCVLEKIKKEIPTADSAESVLRDSARAMSYTQGCR